MAYKLSYSDYSTTTGPPNPAAWVGPPGPMGPPGPQGVPGPMPPGGPFLSLTGGTVTGQVTVQPPNLTTTAFNAAQILNATATGSGTNGPATAQIGLNINHQKLNYLTTSAVGEVDGLYVTVRQGGPGSDVAGILVDVGNTGSGYSAILEGVSTQMAPTTGASVRAVRAQLGTLNPQTPLYNGLLLQAQLGTSSPALLINDIPGQGQWTNFIEGWLGGAQNFVVTNAGLVSAAGGLFSANGYLNVQGHSAGTTGSGAYLMWNKDGGSGGTWLLNQKGGGSGGFHFGEVNTSGVVTDRLIIDSSGNASTSGSVSAGVQLVATNHAPATTSGAYLCWNRGSGDGKSYLLTNRGGGNTGGLIIAEVNASDVPTNLWAVFTTGVYFQTIPLFFSNGAPWHMPTDLVNAASDAAAGIAGVPVGVMYRNGSVLMVRVV